MSTKNVLLSQVIMTFLMASLMSGLMSLIHSGPSMQWLRAWPGQFIIAWPIAFALTMVCWPIAMKLSSRILPPGPVAQKESEPLEVEVAS